MPDPLAPVGVVLTVLDEERLQDSVGVRVGVKEIDVDPLQVGVAL